MTANQILDVILGFFALVVVPIQLVTTFLLGILAICTFGLLLLPLSLVWIALVFPLIGASWLCKQIPILRNPLGLIGIPWAIVAHTYACMMPSMGEVESRASKLMLTWSWPFTWECWQFQTGRLDIWSREASFLREILERISRKNPVMQRTVDRLSLHEELDPQI